METYDLGILGTNRVSLLRKNHSGMETLDLHLCNTTPRRLRKNHSGMETPSQALFLSIYRRRLRKNHSGMETEYNSRK